MLVLEQLAEHLRTRAAMWNLSSLLSIPAPEQLWALEQLCAQGVRKGPSHLVRRLKADVLKNALHDGVQPPGTNVVHCSVHLLSHLQGSCQGVD